jgi:riboflavin kinase/FMN adenylyltransferase
MQILYATSFDTIKIASSVLTIGNFDGVHRGHGALLQRVCHVAEERGIPSVAVTFEPHPLAVLNPDAVPVMITTTSQKLALIEEYGIDSAVVIPFTIEFSRIPAEVFVRTILCDAFGMRHLIIGHDYAFGRGRQGDYQLLESIGASAGFTVEDIDPVGNGSAIYSSSEVRRAVMMGELEQAAAVLGRYHLISGIVVPGEHRGQALGYPTANIETDNQLLPLDGVYAVWVTVGGKHLPGACNIGRNLTFDAVRRTIEVFLLDSDETLYGYRLALHFVRRLRDVRKFGSVEELIGAIAADVERTRTVLLESDQGLIHPGYLC